MVDTSLKPSRYEKNYADRRWQEKLSRTVENHLSYSTTPKATGETWIDGSPIRRIVVDTGTLPNATTTTTAHGITFTNIIHIGGWGTDGSLWIPIPYVHESTAYVKVYVDATNINLKTGANLSTYTTSYVILDYV